MPADNGAVPLVVVDHHYRVREAYSISQRIAVLRAYRDFFDQLGSLHGKQMSYQAVADVVDDAFNSFSHWTSLTDPLFRAIYKKRLDTHTMRNLLRCELSLNVRKVHVRSFRVLDAFLQIVTHDPPEWIEELLERFPEKFPRPSGIERLRISS